MRIVLFTTGLAFGGAETQVVNLATKLKERAWDVRIISMLPPQAFMDELTEANIPVLSLDMRRGFPDPRAIVKSVKHLRQWRPDIVHGHMVHANILSRVCRLFCHIPVLIGTAHSVDEGGVRRELAYRLTDCLSDLTTQVSHAGKERYVKVRAVPADKITVVPNGIDTRHFSPDSVRRKLVRHELGLTGQFVWLAAGRFALEKDYPNLISAFARLVGNQPEAMLLLAGQGPLQTQVEQQVYQLGIQHRVKFLGVRRDMPDLMRAADAYVMSSLWEGMPMVLLEASAVGLPIVCTNVGGNPEVIRDGESGYLVPPSDSEELARAMLRVMDLPDDDLTKLGQVGRTYVDANYSLDRIVDKWEVLYAQLRRRKVRM